MTTDIVTLTVPAQIRYLNIVGAAITAYVERIETADETIAYNLQLAVHEVCTNIIDHAYTDATGQTISISISSAGSGEAQSTAEQVPSALSALMVSIYDEGDAFDLPETIPQPPDTLQERGLGLFLVYELMDDVRYTRRDGRNHWHLMKQLTDSTTD
jgi:serine/threonine-protein kinase RsbW